MSTGHRNLADVLELLESHGVHVIDAESDADVYERTIQAAITVEVPIDIRKTADVDTPTDRLDAQHHNAPKDGNDDPVFANGGEE